MRVWDPLVRALHWGVAGLVMIELVNEAGASPWHRNIGYAAGMLVAARLLWGLIGPAEARLAAIARSARNAPAYLASGRAWREQRLPPGHNPLGACMALALWTLAMIAVATGWMTQLDAYWGDETVQDWHAGASYALAVLAALHVTGVLFMSAVHRVNLVTGMLVGHDTSAPTRRKC